MSISRKNFAQERNKPIFVFIDESGKNGVDRFFVCGFLEIKENLHFIKALQRVADQIKSLSIGNRRRRVNKLYKDENIEELRGLAFSFNAFELKHHRITKENQRLYCDLLKALFEKVDFRFTAVVFDWEQKGGKYQELYSKALRVYAKDLVEKYGYIFIPDNLDINFDWSAEMNGFPVTFLPLESNASLQIQVCDVLTGLVAQALKNAYENIHPNKDSVRKPVLETLESMLGKRITGRMDTGNFSNRFIVRKVE